MKRWLFIMVCALVLPVAGNAQRKRALVVGISAYSSNGYRAWPDIHGAEDAGLLKTALERKGFKVTTLLNEEATYVGILSAFEDFIRKTRKGDVVYWHFSCHGQPVEDGLKRGYPQGDEADEWDESLVPIDAGREYAAKGYRGERHIIDDELRTFVRRLRQALTASGALYVVIDACHAGNMERGDFETVRGTHERLAKNPQHKYRQTDRVERSQVEHSPQLATALFVEACESHQRNQEIRYQGREYGALSFNIWQMLDGMTAFPKDIGVFKARLSEHVRHNKQQRNGWWPGTQDIVFED